MILEQSLAVARHPHGQHVDDQQMREIAAYCGVPYLDDAWPNLPNHTKTWTGRLSDWREHWTPAVDAAWAAAGGPALLERWGY